jgi:DNA-binding HxlR family transcriptional regulator
MNQPIRPQPDAVRSALDALGDRWTYLVLREAYFGVRRFGYFQRNLGIGRNVLAARLSALVEMGMLKRVLYHADPDWYEYRLTEGGFNLFPVILALKAWSDKHLLDLDVPTLDVHHHTCGARLTPTVVCKCCGAPISAADVEYQVIASPALAENPAEDGSCGEEEILGGRFRPDLAPVSGL